MSVRWRDLDCGFGRLRIYEHDGSLVSIALPGESMGAVEMQLARRFPGAEIVRGDSSLLDAAADQICDYAKGERKEFDLPIDLGGTTFQAKVWEALRSIPYGATASYADIAMQVGRPGAARAVGQANARNPVPVVVPCHRVVNADGGLGGYQGGVATDDGIKAELLRLEGAR